MEEVKDNDFDLTPITDMREMGSAIAVIKRDVSEMKPEVKETAKAVIELATKQRVADNRIKVLETSTGRLDRETAALSSPRPHDCINANVIGELSEESKQLALGVAETKKDVDTAAKVIGELRAGQSRFIYWLLGAAVIVIGSVVGWYASYQVTTNEVGHLSVEQTKIRTSLESLQKTTKALPTEINNAAGRVEQVAQQMETNGDEHQGVQLEDIWCIMSEREKVRLKRQLPASKVPNQRCR